MPQLLAQIINGQHPLGASAALTSTSSSSRQPQAEGLGDVELEDCTGGSALLRQDSTLMTITPAAAAQQLLACLMQQEPKLVQQQLQRQAQQQEEGVLQGSRGGRGGRMSSSSSPVSPRRGTLCARVAANQQGTEGSGQAELSGVFGYFSKQAAHPLARKSAIGSAASAGGGGGGGNDVASARGWGTSGNGREAEGENDSHPAGLRRSNRARVQGDEIQEEDEQRPLGNTGQAWLPAADLTGAAGDITCTYGANEVLLSEATVLESKGQERISARQEEEIGVGSLIGGGRSVSALVHQFSTSPDSSGSFEGRGGSTGGAGGTWGKSGGGSNNADRAAAGSIGGGSSSMCISSRRLCTTGGGGRVGVTGSTGADVADGVMSETAQEAEAALRASAAAATEVEDNQAKMPTLAALQEPNPEAEQQQHRLMMSAKIRAAVLVDPRSTSPGRGGDLLSGRAPSSGGIGFGGLEARGGVGGFVKRVGSCGGVHGLEGTKGRGQEAEQQRAERISRGGAGKNIQLLPGSALGTGEESREAAAEGLQVLLAGQMTMLGQQQAAHTATRRASGAESPQKAGAGGGEAGSLSSSVLGAAARISSLRGAVAGAAAAVAVNQGSGGSSAGGGAVGGSGSSGGFVAGPRQSCRGVKMSPGSSGAGAAGGGASGGLLTVEAMLAAARAAAAGGPGSVSPATPKDLARQQKRQELLARLPALGQLPMNISLSPSSSPGRSSSRAKNKGLGASADGMPGGILASPGRVSPEGGFYQAAGSSSSPCNILPVSPRPGSVGPTSPGPSVSPGKGPHFLGRPGVRDPLQDPHRLETDSSPKPFFNLAAAFTDSSSSDRVKSSAVGSLGSLGLAGSSWQQGSAGPQGAAPIGYLSRGKVLAGQNGHGGPEGDRNGGRRRYGSVQGQTAVEGGQGYFGISSGTNSAAVSAGWQQYRGATMGMLYQEVPPAALSPVKDNGGLAAAAAAVRSPVRGGVKAAAGAAAGGDVGLSSRQWRQQQLEAIMSPRAMTSPRGQAPARLLLLEGLLSKGVSPRGAAPDSSYCSSREQGAMSPSGALNSSLSARVAAGAPPSPVAAAAAVLAAGPRLAAVLSPRLLEVAAASSRSRSPSPGGGSYDSPGRDGGGDRWRPMTPHENIAPPGGYAVAWAPAAGEGPPANVSRSPKRAQGREGGKVGGPSLLAVGVEGFSSRDDGRGDVRQKYNVGAAPPAAEARAGFINAYSKHNDSRYSGSVRGAEDGGGKQQQYAGLPLQWWPAVLGVDVVHQQQQQPLMALLGRNGGIPLGAAAGLSQSPQQRSYKRSPSPELPVTGLNGRLGLVGSLAEEVLGPDRGYSRTYCSQQQSYGRQSPLQQYQQESGRGNGSLPLNSLLSPSLIPPSTPPPAGLSPAAAALLEEEAQVQGLAGGTCRACGTFFTLSRAAARAAEMSSTNTFICSTCRDEQAAAAAAAAQQSSYNLGMLSSSTNSLGWHPGGVLNRKVGTRGFGGSLGPQDGEAGLRRGFSGVMQDQGTAGVGTEGGQGRVMGWERGAPWMQADQQERVQEEQEQEMYPLPARRVSQGWYKSSSGSYVFEEGQQQRSGSGGMAGSWGVEPSAVGHVSASSSASGGQWVAGLGQRVVATEGMMPAASMAESWGEGDPAGAVGGGAAGFNGVQPGLMDAEGPFEGAVNLQELVQQLQDPPAGGRGNSSGGTQQQQLEQEWLRQRGLSAPPGALRGLPEQQQTMKGRKEASQSAMLAGEEGRAKDPCFFLVCALPCFDYLYLTSTLPGFPMVRDPCNLYTKEPFPQSHAGEQYTVSSRRSLSLSVWVSWVPQAFSLSVGV